MGRHYSSKQEADYLKKVDIYWLKKYHYLDGYKRCGIEWSNSYSGKKTDIGVQSDVADQSPYVRLFYTQTNNETGEVKQFDYKIPLTTTPCHFGGNRYWFICPLSKNGVYCGKRVGVLYKDGDYFGCRHCYDLSYSSRNVNKKYVNTYPFSVLIADRKIEQLEPTVKRRFYNGKPTKRQAKLDRLYRAFKNYSP